MLMRAIMRIVSAVLVMVSATAAAHAQGLVRDTEIEAIMRAYTNPLLEAADLEPVDVDIYLVSDMEFNAFVTRGQNIFLNTGLIVRAETPLEIKGVIAHEIGHIEGAHLIRIGNASRGAMATMAASMALGLAAALAGEGGAGAALMASAPQFATLDVMRYSRAQEAAADQAAVRFLTATGQSGRGLVSIFERLRYREIFTNQRRWEYFRSHPLAGDRVDALRRNVEASPYADIADTEEEVAALRRIQAKIIGFMVPPAQTFHRYPESDQSIPARYARSVAYYKQGLMDRAEEELSGLIELEPDNPFFHELHGQMLYESGSITASIAPNRRALELMPQAPLLRIGLATSLIADGAADHVDEAVTHLRHALASEPRNAMGWFQLSLAHQARGEIAEAELATAERAFAVGDNITAFQFASRARDELDRGTPAYIRAIEIIAAAQPSPAEIREYNRRRQELPRSRTR